MAKRLKTFFEITTIEKFLPYLGTEQFEAIQWLECNYPLLLLLQLRFHLVSYGIAEFKIMTNNALIKKNSLHEKSKLDGLSDLIQSRIFQYLVSIFISSPYS